MKSCLARGRASAPCETLQSLASTLPALRHRPSAASALCGTFRSVCSIPQCVLPNVRYSCCAAAPILSCHRPYSTRQNNDNNNNNINNNKNSDDKGDGAKPPQEDPPGAPTVNERTGFNFVSRNKVEGGSAKKAHRSSFTSAAAPVAGAGKATEKDGKVDRREEVLRTRGVGIGTVSFSANDDVAAAEGGDGSTTSKPSLTMSERMREHERSVAKTKAKPEHGPIVPDHGPLRATGMWKVEEVMDKQKETVDFRRIDDVESDIMEAMKQPDNALMPYDEEERWKHHLMFVEKVDKTPKHLTWKELAEEIECVDCVIDLDEHRPEEIFYVTFYFVNKKTGVRDVVWRAKNDVAYSEGFTDLMSAIGACLGRSDVHRTIRFDDGMNTTRDITIRKRSRYTSDITIAFRPAESYNKYERKDEEDEFEKAMASEGMSTWGFHPSLMDPEYNALDFEDPENTYTVAISAHAFSIIFLRAIKRLLGKPMKSFYRPSQVMRTARIKSEDDIGLMHAMKGWLGIDEIVYPHYTPIEAIQEHWLGKDAPFTLTAIINKLRQMTYLKTENPEFQSWLSVRHHDTNVAIRNMGVKLLGAGASTLFVPVGHDATVNRLLPKHQQRRLESRISLNSLLGMPDETRNIEDFKKLTGFSRLSDNVPTTSKPSTATTTQTTKDTPNEQESNDTTTSSK